MPGERRDCLVRIGRLALVVGIDYYKHLTRLSGCISDSREVRRVLERNYDGSVNFAVKALAGTKSGRNIRLPNLKAEMRELFCSSFADTVLFYFAGHGYVDESGAYLLTGECRHGDEGLSLMYLQALMEQSGAREKIVILDCCYAGAVGSRVGELSRADLCEGSVIIAASSATRPAIEVGGQGVFSRLLVDALEGAAANLVGEITPSRVYAHIDERINPRYQRPVVKMNTERYVSLRSAKPSIAREDLRQIVRLFPVPDDEFLLNPSFEPTSEESREGHVKKFAVLQKFNRVNLVIPVGAEHMYYAAMESKSCRLTVEGKHYWELVKNGFL